MITTKPRGCLSAVTPYLPGKPIGEVRRELGLRSVLKLASNENPLGPSPKALAAARRALERAHIYPEGASPLLRARLAAHHGVEPGCVIVGNGSDEVIRLVCLAFLSEGDPVAASQYGFIRFCQQAGMMGAKVTEVPMRGWRHDLDAMAEACTNRTKAVFIVSPNNPTGTFNSELELRRFLARVPRSTLVLLDEAYCHYAAARPDYHGRSVPELVRRYPNLLVLRTFSKAYGLAGLRVGYGLGDPELIRVLDKIRMPFNVNLPAQFAAEAALGDVAFLRASVKLIDSERAVLRRNLEALGFSVPESGANFLFADAGRDVRALSSALLRQGVIVRPLGEYGLNNHLRITVGSAPQNRRLLASLRQALGANGRGSVRP